jgi:IS30 family transposase
VSWGCAVQQFGLSVAEQERVWVLRGSGLSLRALASVLGQPPHRVKRYVAACGGKRPVLRRRAARCLSVTEREEVSRGLADGHSARWIAAAIGRSSSTVSREIARNGGRVVYRAAFAEAACWDRARRPKIAKLAANGPLREQVEEHLKIKWSPEQIVGWLARTYPGDEAMQISHETIYLSLFIQARGALKHELTEHLRSRRGSRRAQSSIRSGQGRGQIKDKILISERPAEAEDRAVPGHWEGDLLLGSRPTAIATLVERSTRFTQLVALPDGIRAEPVRLALAASIATLPEQLRRSLTWDQGLEMAEHKQLTVDSGLQVYFCDPKSPWQRGSNENTNGLLRQYFAKRTAISLSQSELDEVAAQLNARPRKTLGFMTPAEKLAELTGVT